MNFIAIDFETANEKRNSPCSIGLVVVKEGEVVEKLHYLIKPKEMRFLPMNVWIHGITEEQVINEKEFDEIWEDINGYFNDTLIVAHNAAFDISVLRNTLELYNIDKPNFKYICTMKLAKSFYPNLENAKLNTVNEFLGFNFNHHNALDDAEACANILLNISEELQLNDIRDISMTTGVTIGEVNSNGYTPSSQKGRVYKTSKRTLIKKEEKINNSFIPESIKDEVIVFTGRLSSMSRGDAMCRVRRLGATTGGTVTKKTTLLVAAVRDIEKLTLNMMSTKLRKATLLKESGHNIKIINEEQFLEMIR